MQRGILQGGVAMDCKRAVFSLSEVRSGALFAENSSRQIRTASRYEA